MTPSSVTTEKVGPIAFWGGDGNDSILSASQGDVVDGGAGQDTLTGGGEFIDFIFSVAPGAANADLIAYFSTGADTVVLDGAVHANIGTSGDFTDGDARFWSSGTGMAHDADDRVIYNSATGQLWYDADGTGGAARQLIATVVGPQLLTATDISVINGSVSGVVINGTSGNDTLSGTSGNDTINGLGGNDVILAGSTGGSDVINGGDGSDSIEFKAAASSGIVVNYNAGTITGGSAGGSISFSGIERVVGGNFNDSMSGTVGSQNLAGQAGADTLTGGAGNDTLWGGTGNDAFMFNGMGTANADRISDFASGQDKVQLEDGAFTAIGAMGNFAAGDARFWSSGTGTAHDANDRVIYNTSTGQLYYDADGNGGGTAQLVATIAGAPAFVATDIAVI
jgi:Ca2+-binding RTX toxin-like protein